ncbi:MAG TPA: GvpL/GvpF family gas vesicle protein [Terriglobales bacterium]|nr:GvpL/GvpF family gas vesicle protein [Terriglobales bacterium]
MPILLYCVARREKSPVGNAIRGVAGSLVRREEYGPLSVFVSCESDSAKWLKQEIRTSALEFHGVLKQLFEHFVVIPFRFPTIFVDDEELAKHLEPRSGEYSEQLERFSDFVQMELRVISTVPRTSSGSGTDYLNQRQNAMHSLEQFAGELKNRLAAYSKEWRQRATKQGLRAFALVARNAISDFENAVRNLQIPADLKVRVSGPWPASEFIDQG